MSTLKKKDLNLTVHLKKLEKLNPKMERNNKDQSSNREQNKRKRSMKPRVANKVNKALFSQTMREHESQHVGV